MLQVREPGANHAFDAITHRPWTVVVFERGRSEEAATGEDLPLRVADHVVAERPDSCESFRRTAGRIDDLGDEELGRVLDGRQLQLFLGAEVGEQPALAHPGRLRQPADRKGIEAFLGRQCRGDLEDRGSRSLSFRF